MKEQRDRDGTWWGKVRKEPDCDWDPLHAGKFSGLEE